MRKPKTKKKRSDDFFDCDKKTIIECAEFRSENLRMRKHFSMRTVIQAMNEASMFYGHNFCSGAQRTNFEEMFWTEAIPAFVPEDEGGSSIESS